FLPVNWKAGEFTLSWVQAANINWGTILLFGGGLAFGSLMVQTDLAATLGGGIVRWFGVDSLWALTAMAIVAALVLTELASNTAAASMLVPVVIAIAHSAGVSPLPPTLGTCLAASLAFVLPVSTPPNAIVYGTGLVPITKMVRAGLLLDLLGGALIWVVLRLLCPLLGMT
ncbi:MAG: SLC13 family permease, partial [Nitrospirota bacterium]|nr:SLC13 family permease [Nitrospirota bacterium]